MLAKYRIVFDVDPHHRAAPAQFTTDDPVAAEALVADLIERRQRIREILHEGVALEGKAFDHLVRLGAQLVASRHLQAAFGISGAEVNARFGLPG